MPELHSSKLSRSSDEESQQPRRDTMTTGDVGSYVREGQLERTENI